MVLRSASAWCRAAPSVCGSRCATLALNAAGEPADETTYIEYNDLLCEPGWETPVARALFNWAQAEAWDEFTFDGFASGPGLQAVRAAFSSLPLRERVCPSRFVDLDAARQAGTSYVALLSPRNREQLRRKIRYQEQAGPLSLERATTAPQACQMLEELAQMNCRRMDRLGRAGVFASGRFLAFHQQFLGRAIELGKADLFRLRCAGDTVGVVYNLVENDKVYFYQCGYLYSEDKRLSPGTVTLAHVIQHELEHGRKEFDFLAGEESYKHWMSTGGRELTWLAARRPNARVRLYDLARSLRGRIARHAKGASQA